MCGICGLFNFSGSPVDGQRIREMADAIPGAQLATISEAGHFPWVEQPAAFRAALDRFLTEG